MKDYSLMFILIDDLVEEITKIEDNIIINHMFN